MVYSNLDMLAVKRKLFLDKITPQPFVSNDKKFDFEWICEVNITELLSIRNQGFVRDMFNSSEKINICDHKDFIDRYSDISRIDFIIKNSKTSELIGAVYLSLENNKFYLGKYIGNVNYLGQGIAKKAVIQFLSFCVIHFGRIDIYAITRGDNIRNISVNKSLGFEIINKFDSGFIEMLWRVK